MHCTAPHCSTYSNPHSCLLTLTLTLLDVMLLLSTTVKHRTMFEQRICPSTFSTHYITAGQAQEADVVIRLSALGALRSLLSLWDLDPESCLAPALGWLVPALYGMFDGVEEMDNRQEVGGLRTARRWTCEYRCRCRCLRFKFTDHADNFDSAPPSRVVVEPRERQSQWHAGFINIIEIHVHPARPASLAVTLKTLYT